MLQQTTSSDVSSSTVSVDKINTWRFRLQMISSSPFAFFSSSNVGKHILLVGSFSRSFCPFLLNLGPNSGGAPLGSTTKRFARLDSYSAGGQPPKLWVKLGVETSSNRLVQNLLLQWCSVFGLDSLHDSNAVWKMSFSRQNHRTPLSNLHGSVLFIWHSWITIVNASVWEYLSSDWSGSQNV